MCMCSACAVIVFLHRIDAGDQAKVTDAPSSTRWVILGGIVTFSPAAIGREHTACVRRMSAAKQEPRHGDGGVRVKIFDK